MDSIPCTYRISVKASIKDSAGRVLLVRENDGSWELPGGGLEHDESVKEAMAREISEETGLTVEHVSDRPEAFWTIRQEVGSPTIKWFAFVVYDVTVSGTFRPDPAGVESQEARYVTRDEALTLNLHNNTKPYFMQIP